MKKTVTSTSIVIAAVLAAVSAAAVGINIAMVRHSARYIAASPRECRHAQAAVLLGAGVYSNKRVSAVAYDRIVTAAELYNAGKVQKILITGDHGTPYYDEVNTILHWLRKFNIPESDIFTDHAGFSTYESIVRARRVFEVESAVLVTQEFHLPRALYIAAGQGIKVQGYRADRQKYIYIKRYTAREYFARVKDFLNVHLFRPTPRFLGAKLPITGDGRKSRD